MKIIVVSNVHKLLADEIPSVALAVDSSMLRQGEPMFVDEDVNTYQAMFAPAIRVGRLGTNIPLRFAQDYIDAHSIVMIRWQENAWENIGLWGLQDRNFAPGEWVDGTFNNDDTLSASISCLRDDKIISSFEPHRIFDANGAAIANATLAWLSQKTTFKTGDIIILQDFAAQLPMAVDTRVSASINDTVVLSCKLK